MNTQKPKQKEDRSLSYFVKAKIGISLSDFAKEEEEKENTLYARWNSPTGKSRVMDSVFRAYVRRYDDL